MSALAEALVAAQKELPCALGSSSGTGHDAPARAEECPTLQFLDDVRAVVTYHWSGLPEKRPAESVWARLDAVLFDDLGISRVQPDYTANPNATGALDAR